MTRALTERESFAGVLASLVQQRCMETRTPKTSRTGLQSEVPVDERPYVRRGLDALIDHGALVMTGEDIGFTPTGTAFVTFLKNVEQHGDTVEEDAARHPLLPTLLKAIALEERLQPPRPLEDIRTLPARLEGYRVHRRSSGLRRWGVLFGAAAVAAGAFIVLR